MLFYAWPLVAPRRAHREGGKSGGGVIRIAEPYCVFCCRKGTEGEFDEEHVLPKSVGGKLTVHGLICKDCNSRFGSQVDCEILKLPDVLTAKSELLGAPWNLHASYYDARLVSDTGSFKAIATPTGFELLQQRLPDGSTVVPEGADLESVVWKMVRRGDKDLSSKLTPEQSQARVRDLLRRHEAAPIGAPVAYEELGPVLVKRSDQLRAEFAQNSLPRVDRLVGKACYEMLFLCLGKHFAEYAPTWITDLRDLVVEGVSNQKVQIFRSAPQDTRTRPEHYLYFEVLPGYTKGVLGLFGSIEYTLIAPSMSAEAMNKLLGIPDVSGVAYQQVLKPLSRRLWLLHRDGSASLIGEF